jgi:hypothetical protein
MVVADIIPRAAWGAYARRRELGSILDPVEDCANDTVTRSPVKVGRMDIDVRQTETN